MLRNIRAAGTGSIFGCVLTMFALYVGWLAAGKVLFGASLLALREIQISVETLNIELNNLQAPNPPAA